MRSDSVGEGIVGVDMVRESMEEEQLCNRQGACGLGWYIAILMLALEISTLWGASIVKRHIRY
jgi:hypothetical protein